MGTAIRMANQRETSEFNWGDWRRDPDLSRCSKAAKGAWMDMLAVGFECEQPGIFATAGTAWSIEEIARAIGGDVPENSTLIQELLTKGVARRAPSGAIFCRRMVQDEEAYTKEKADNNDRVKRHRTRARNGPVTANVTVEKCSSEELGRLSLFKDNNNKELKVLTEKLFLFYCSLFKRNPNQYTLTEKRHKKAELRLAERLKIHNGDLVAVEQECQRAMKNLAASDFHQENGFFDWEDQIFRSDEEYQKRINMKPQGKAVDGGIGRGYVAPKAKGATNAN